jgi:hypothetical protein
MINTKTLIRGRAMGFLASLLVLATAAAVLLPRAKSSIRLKLKDVVAEAVREQTPRVVQVSAWDESRHIGLAINRRVADQSAAFVANNMPAAKDYADKFALMDAALQRVAPNLKGMWCEFGVYKGTTINYIASKTAGPVYGFDSFEGLPEDWRPGFEAGVFKTPGLPAVRANVRLYRGWFKDSLPIFEKDHPEPLAFGHLDADLYSSTKDVFEALGNRIVAGTVLQFDEFFNYPSWEEGESKAFLQFCQARQAEIEYIGYVASDQQVAVRINKIAPPRLPRAR